MTLEIFSSERFDSGTFVSDINKIDGGTARHCDGRRPSKDSGAPAITLCEHSAVRCVNAYKSACFPRTTLETFVGLRTCKRCKIAKPPTAYSPKGFYCKQCYIDALRAWRERNSATKNYEVVETAKCRFCRKSKLLTEMQCDKGTKTGYDTCCRSCSKERYLARKLQNATV